jgi:hypothetical protein
MNLKILIVLKNIKIKNSKKTRADFKSFGPTRI